MMDLDFLYRGAWMLCFKLPGRFLSFATCSSNFLRAADHPNIVFILADDLGYGDLGCYNPQSKIPTPRLDQLARQGMRFRDAHSPSSVCTPTRYALLTGRYAWRTRLQRNVLGPWDKPLIAADRLTVGKLLQQHGYVTACIGKWHLGQNYVTTDGKAPSGGVKNVLTNVDFAQQIAMVLSRVDSITTSAPSFQLSAILLYRGWSDCWYPLGSNARRRLQHTGPMVPGWRLEDILPKLTDHAVQWIEETARGKKPFYLYFALTSPHYPVVPAADFAGKTEVGAYGDFVHQTDWSVGRVLDALERAGVADNTLVIFTSDNGAEITGEVNPGAYDRVQQFQHRSSGELRGAKRDAWEGGHRVPFIARLPSRIKAGSISDEVICHVDFMRTVAAILEAKVPDNAAEDSVNLLPVLRGEHLDAPLREATVYHSARGKFAIRQGDWVLIDAPSGDDNGANGEPQWLKKERGYSSHEYPGELFNVHDDLAQCHNMWAEKPELVSKLQTLLKKYIAEGRSTRALRKPMM